MAGGISPQTDHLQSSSQSQQQYHNEIQQIGRLIEEICCLVPEQPQKPTSTSTSQPDTI
ncbi:hypothetical protein BGX26_010145 [Mortierella sp. AD094]|nr:hypothetical protein BGX26_010145 [Mortierella sp. AD094]